ncbi:MAG TPA: MobF family relaxase [Opitutaceae bacterium]|nr:MobF family relaxase [Opitutaceae bacterium]
MLTIQPSKEFTHALGEYLRQADYYSEGMKVEGRCFGQLCAAVGLTENSAISDEAFARVASNHHALTGDHLTERMKTNRRAGYDATFNAPKSVSIQAFLGGDERLIAAHETAVAEALVELETFARRQDGQGINKRHVPTGQLAGAIFRHGESRALDPHLHSHVFLFNVTADRSQPGRLTALESSAIFEHAPYLTEVYRNVMAREVRALGYAIERREHGFELSDVPRHLLERFSKRAKERDRVVAAREADLGRELSRDEIALLVREHRPKKHYELSPDDVRKQQEAQVSADELQHLCGLRTASPAAAPQVDSLDAVIRQTAEHLFERKTVVPLREFTAEVIRQTYGVHSLAEIKAAVHRAPAGLLVADNKVSSEAALAAERTLVAKVNAGVAQYGELGFLSRDALSTVSAEQRGALATLLNSCDRVTIFRGRAGTGKTTTLAHAIEGMAAITREVACFAPSTQAVSLLQKDGADQLRAGRKAAGEALAAAGTVQRLLVDSAQQVSIKGKLVIVDEYGLLSVGQLNALVNIAEKQGARLLLVGDSAQHKSVEAGDGARIMEHETRATVAELRQIRRQSANPAYLAAAQDLAAGRIGPALGKLDAMGAVVEIENPGERRRRMVEEWHAVTQRTTSVRTMTGVQERALTALMVAPTWQEIDALNACARAKLRAHRQISGDDQTFVSLVAKNWTKAQQKQVRNYQPGDVLVAHKATKHFRKHDELRVVRREADRLVVSRRGEEFSVSPRQAGQTWVVCDERSLAVAAGDRLRLRSIGRAIASSGERRSLANGTTVSVKSVDVTGRLVLADGSTLATRQVVHGYALTSHAAQGLTVDHVFLAGANSREGLYVSATRGREGIRIFVPDREVFLEAAGLRSEARMSALEFARLRDAVVPPDLPRWLEPLRQTVRYLGWVRQRRAGGYSPSDHDSTRRGVAVREAPAARIRI